MKPPIVSGRSYSYSIPLLARWSAIITSDFEQTASHGRYRSRDLCLAYMNALAAGDPDAEVDP